MTIESNQDRCAGCGESHEPWDLCPQKAHPAEIPKVDPTMREWPAMSPSGRLPQDAAEAMGVLRTLMHHLRRTGDGQGQQLLSRIWRVGSPVIAHILTFNNDPVDELQEKERERRIAFQTMVNNLGHMLDCEIGDDLIEKLPQLVRQARDDAKLLRDFIELCEKPHGDPIWNGGVRVYVDEKTRTGFVQVGDAKRHTVFAAGTVRSAMRLAIDGEKEANRG